MDTVTPHGPVVAPGPHTQRRPEGSPPRDHLHVGAGLLAAPPTAGAPYLRRRERRRRGAALAEALRRGRDRSRIVSDRNGVAPGRAVDGVTLGRDRRPRLPLPATLRQVLADGADTVLHLHLDDLIDVAALTVAATAHRGVVVLHLQSAVGHPLRTGDTATWQHRMFGLPVQRQLLDRADLVVVGGAGLAQLVHDGGARHTAVIPPAPLPTPERWVGATRPPRTDVRHLVSVGPLTARRRPAALIRALPRLPADVHLTLLGTGPSRLELERLATELRVGDRVRVAPTASWATVLAHLHGADVVVASPLLGDDPDPLLLAMAAGRTVVATRVDRIAEVLTDRVDGRLVAPLADTALAATIDEVLDDPAAAAAYGASARRRVAARGWDAVAREVMAALAAS